MKLVLIDQLGCYAALVGAAYLTGQIGGQPASAEILQLPDFARHKDLQPGELYDCGRDKRGTRVYALGVGCEAKIMMVSAADIFQLLGVREEIRILDMSLYNGFTQKIWWFLGLIPVLKELSRNKTADILAASFAQIKAYLLAELSEAGLEYS